MKTFFRYLLFQVPEWLLLALFLWLLVDRSAVPDWTGEVFFACWVVKDLVLYPWLRRAYETEVRTGVDRLISAKGVTQERLDPEGYVRIHGELWKARADFADKIIDPETKVRVRAAAGMTLIVRPETRHVEVSTRR